MFDDDIHVKSTPVLMFRSPVVLVVKPAWPLDKNLQKWRPHRGTKHAGSSEISWVYIDTTDI